MAVFSSHVCEEKERGMEPLSRKNKRQPRLGIISAGLLDCGSLFPTQKNRTAVLSFFAVLWVFQKESLGTMKAAHFNQCYQKPGDAEMERRGLKLFRLYLQFGAGVVSEYQVFFVDRQILLFSWLSCFYGCGMNWGGGWVVCPVLLSNGNSSPNCCCNTQQNVHSKESK